MDIQERIDKLNNLFIKLGKQTKRDTEKAITEILYGFGTCSKCGAKDIRFSSKGNLTHHNGCKCRTAKKPVGILGDEYKKKGTK